MNPDGRAAIVTGGAGGLGSATVRRLHGLGMGVVVFDLDGDRARALAGDIGRGVVGVGGDTAEDDDIAAAIDAARPLGALSVVVNVAGGGVGGGRMVGRDGTPHPLEGFVATMAMNATGTFNMSRLVAAAMGGNQADEDGQRGVVVNVASIAGLEGPAGQVAYAAAKAAILGMTLPMARDLAPLGIRVCSIAPGTMGTPLMLGALPHLKKDPVEGIVFPKRMGYPDEFALLVEGIVLNPYLNGENIRLDAALRFNIN